VDRYLKTNGLQYQAKKSDGSNNSYWISIGEEPGDGLVCNRWWVYIAVDFSATDDLASVHLQKIGHCL
jgi:hypothetical protein